MNREEAVELAKSYAAKGFLCSEAVLLAVSSWLGVKSEIIPRVATGFGGGTGGQGSVCWAVSGGIMALGLKYGRNDPVRHEGRRPYRFAKEFLDRFEEGHGTILCRELTGCDIATEEGRKKYADEKTWDTKCRGYIGEATAIIIDLVAGNT